MIRRASSVTSFPWGSAQMPPGTRVQSGSEVVHNHDCGRRPGRGTRGVRHKATQLVWRFLWHTGFACLFAAARWSRPDRNPVWHFADESVHASHFSSRYRTRSSRSAGECLSDPLCGKAFPKIRSEAKLVLERLIKSPVEVESTKEPPKRQKRKQVCSAGQIQNQFVARSGCRSDSLHAL